MYGREEVNPSLGCLQIKLPTIEILHISHSSWMMLVGINAVIASQGVPSDVSSRVSKSTNIVDDIEGEGCVRIYRGCTFLRLLNKLR